MAGIISRDPALEAPGDERQGGASPSWGERISLYGARISAVL